MASSGIDHAEIKLLNDNIDVLLSCKPLPESSIKLLCDKVSHSSLFYIHIVFAHSIQVSPSLCNNYLKDVSWVMVANDSKYEETK